MKKTFFYLFITSTLAINAQEKQDRSANLIGYAQKSDFLKKQYKDWFENNYKNYRPNQKIVKKIKKNLKGITILCFMGTWCGDSKREIPRFYRIMEATNFNFKKQLQLIALNRQKKTPNSLQKGYDIIRIPTFIFYKKGKEIGRYVEYPRQTIEKDILKILKGKPYKHSYQK